MCTLLDDVDEPLDDDDDEPLDDELPDEDDDVVLSSSLSTSFFARRGLSLTPPRRGLSLMPRLSISPVPTGWSCRGNCGTAWFGAALSCPLWLSRRSCRACAGSTSRRWGLVQARSTSVAREVCRLEDDSHRLLCGLTVAVGFLVSYSSLANLALCKLFRRRTSVKWLDEPSFVAAVDVLRAANAQTNLVACGRCQSLCSHPTH